LFQAKSSEGKSTAAGARSLDNATGQIHDEGIVNCAAAAGKNAEAWGQLLSDQKATQIRRAFQKQ